MAPDDSTASRRRFQWLGPCGLTTGGPGQRQSGTRRSSARDEFLVSLMAALEAQKREAENPVNQDAQARVEARRQELESMRVRDSIDAQRSRFDQNRDQWVSDSLANEARAAAVLDSLRRAGMQINSAEVRPMESPSTP